MSRRRNAISEYPTRSAAPTFAAIMDEAAAAIRPLSAVRVTLSTLAGVMALLILPAGACATWVAGAFCLEAWCWFATRAPPPGAPVNPRARANFIANYAATNLWWLLLAVLFWSAGSVAGQAAGVALAVILGSICGLLFYNVPLVFLVAGMAPAASALTVLGLADGRGWRQLTPIWGVLGIGVLFKLGRAIDSPSVQQSNRRLKAILRDYEILTETVTDVITRCDLDGVRQYVSPACFAMIGYRPDELIGRSRWETSFLEADIQGRLAAFHRMLEDPSRSEVVTFRTRHKNGRMLWLQSNAKLVCEDGAPVGVIDFTRDVTAQVEGEIALREAKAEAEVANSAKADFLANISHEIRTPMNGVLGALQLLNRDDISAEERDLMRQADDCGRMLSQLLDDVLDFSKIEAGQMEIKPEAMHLGEALNVVGALLRPEASTKGVELMWEISGDQQWVEADPVRVRQLMFNLLGNAVKFTEQGRITARLVVDSCGGSSQRVRLEVEDTGIGMTPEVQAHLFERFGKAGSDTGRRIRGAGLGLAITRALAHSMGGEIGFASTAGEGSTFWVTFDAPAARPVVSEPEAGGVLEGVSILLVEDNPTNRLVARTLLTRLGASVEEAEDGLAGFEAARCGAHDLILMDIQMPRMDGVEATRAIRALAGPVAEVPIIALTANVMEHQQVEYRAAGMDGVCAKPISPGALLAEIARVVAGDESTPATAAA